VLLPKVMQPTRRVLMTALLISRREEEKVLAI